MSSARTNGRVATTANSNGSSSRADALPEMLPFLAMHRAMSLPIVESAWLQSQSIYAKVKGYNFLTTWALGKAELTVQSAMTCAAPLIHKLDGPLHLVDQTIVKTIEKLEETLPSVKEEPAKLYQDTKEAIKLSVRSRVDCVKKYGTKKVLSLKELSLKKANQVLGTRCGGLAVNGVDFTSQKAEIMLNHYLPAVESDNVADKVISAEDDRALHTAQTVGRIGNILVHRVYNKMSRQVTSNKNEVHNLVVSVVIKFKFQKYIDYIKNNNFIQIL